MSCSVAGAGGSLRTALSRKDAWIGTRSELLVSPRVVTLMAISGMSLSIAARWLPQVGQKPRFASPSKVSCKVSVSYQVSSPPSPVQVTDPNPAAQATAGTFASCSGSLGVGGGGVVLVISPALWASWTYECASLP